MTTKTVEIGTKFILQKENLDQLVQILIQRKYQVIGPTIVEQAIAYDEIESIKDLPEGWTEEQEPGKYRLKKRTNKALFGYTVGPHSWKKFLHPPEKKLWSAKKEGKQITIIPEEEETPQFAFFGVRPCDLRAIQIQDKVFKTEDYTDPTYYSRREKAFILVVNCSQAASTCFCVSMNAGPKATKGFDLALTEICENDKHEFLIEVGSALGNEILSELKIESAKEEAIQTAEKISQNTETQMGRQIKADDLKELLYRNYESPCWKEIATRCMNCANCTMTCPTCFCATVEEMTDLTGEHAERWRKWDSCFTMDHSYIHGGSIRRSASSRYRQWMTHKLATWHDQFQSSGCTGCGRCITWCPVGIDITKEVNAIRQSEVKEK